MNLFNFKKTFVLLEFCLTNVTYKESDISQYMTTCMMILQSDLRVKVKRENHLEYLLGICDRIPNHLMLDKFFISYTCNGENLFGDVQELSNLFREYKSIENRLKEIKAEEKIIYNGY